MIYDCHLATKVVYIIAFHCAKIVDFTCESIKHKNPIFKKHEKNIFKNIYPQSTSNKY